MCARVDGRLVQATSRRRPHTRCPSTRWTSTASDLVPWVGRSHEGPGVLPGPLSHSSSSDADLGWRRLTPKYDELVVHRNQNFSAFAAEFDDCETPARHVKDGVRAGSQAMRVISVERGSIDELLSVAVEVTQASRTSMKPTQRSTKPYATTTGRALNDAPRG